MSGASVIGGGSLGAPAGNLQFEGVADLNGNRMSSILFLNTTTGHYISWDLDDATVTAQHDLGSPGAGFSFLKVT